MLCQLINTETPGEEVGRGHEEITEVQLENDIVLLANMTSLLHPNAYVLSGKLRELEPNNLF